jgi:hypothetical protein
VAEPPRLFFLFRVGLRVGGPWGDVSYGCDGAEEYARKESAARRLQWWRLEFVPQRALGHKQVALSLHLWARRRGRACLARWRWWALGRRHLRSLTARLQENRRLARGWAQFRAHCARRAWARVAAREWARRRLLRLGWGAIRGLGARRAAAGEAARALQLAGLRGRLLTALKRWRGEVARRRYLRVLCVEMAGAARVVGACRAGMRRWRRWAGERRQREARVVMACECRLQRAWAVMYRRLFVLRKEVLKQRLAAARVMAAHHVSRRVWRALAEYRQTKEEKRLASQNNSVKRPIGSERSKCSLGALQGCQGPCGRPCVPSGAAAVGGAGGASEGHVRGQGAGGYLRA